MEMMNQFNMMPTVPWKIHVTQIHVKMMATVWKNLVANSIVLAGTLTMVNFVRWVAPPITVLVSICGFRKSHLFENLNMAISSCFIYSRALLERSFFCLFQWSFVILCFWWSFFFFLLKNYFLHDISNLDLSSARSFFIFLLLSDMLVLVKSKMQHQKNWMCKNWHLILYKY